MGIELELHSRRPAIGKGSRASLLRGSYRHGDALAAALDRLDRDYDGKLGWVDPYGDTVFNAQEAESARREVAELLRRCTDEPQRAALTDLAELLRECATTPGSLWFMGD